MCRVSAWLQISPLVPFKDKKTMIKTLIGLVSITLGLLALAVAARIVVEIWRDMNEWRQDRSA